MAMERQDYPAMLPQLQPPQAVDILNDRVRQVGRVNVAIADWLQERRRLEEMYSGGLRKLSQKQLDGVDLGVFSSAWTALTGSADALSDSHSALATKIEIDVERPLRDFGSSSREMSAISTVQGNLSAMAKEVERAQQKTDKLRDRGERAGAGKVANASTELDSAQTQWESQAPYIFESLQALDETRLNHLRDVLTQFQTHEVDQVEKSRVTAEQCLNVLLNVETADEIKTFALKAVQLPPTLGRASRSSVSAGTPSRAGTASNASALTPVISQPDEELYSTRSGSVQEEKQRGRLKGLKRLGTVMGRKRESKLPANLPPMAESPERKPRPSPFNSFSNKFGRSKDSAPNLAPPSEESPIRERPRSPLRLGSEVFQAPSRIAEPTSPSPAANNLGSTAHVNGTSSAASTVPPAAQIPNGSHQGDLADLEPPKPDFSSPSALPTNPAEPQKDSEGYSVRPQNLDPISQAQQDAALAGEGSAQQFNVNIRDAPIREEAGSSEAALANVANKLQAPPPATRRGGTIRGRRQDRNSVINSTYSPIEPPITSEVAPEPVKEVQETSPTQTGPPAIQTATPIIAGALTQSPSGAFSPGQAASNAFSPFTPLQEQPPSTPLRPESRAAAGLDHNRTDSQSIRSATTSASQGGLKHPELNDRGLNSSIIETVSARFESGKLASSSLTGEIALAYNLQDGLPPTAPENIRLEGFAGLEKVAPNPAFINQTPDKEGEYSVDVSKISRTQVAFKYQTRLDDGDSQAPMLVAPAFKIEPNQCSIIVSYSLNPKFALKGRDSVTLSNVVLALTVEGAKATSCLSKPMGTFSREKNLIFWQLNDITLRPAAAPEKLLARFVTDSEANSGGVECRWEITGENAQGLGSGLSVSSQSQSGGAADPFADEDAQAASWKPVQGARKLTAGSYVAR